MSRELDIRGSWLFSPAIHRDDRGEFVESFTQLSFQEAVGFSFAVKQLNVSRSVLGTVRGIHFADVPPGQAKYLQCLQGRILDVIVDIRVGSPTFGQWQSVELDSDTRESVYLAEGLGHAFCALSDSATVGYMCSQPYAPEREHSVHPLDPDLSITWPENFDLNLSPKDSTAPSLSAAAEAGLLPSWEACQDFTARLAEW